MDRRYEGLGASHHGSIIPRIITALLFLIGGAISAYADLPASISVGTSRQIDLVSDSGDELLPGVRVVGTDEDGLELEFSLPALQATEVSVDGRSYYLLEIAGGGSFGDEGAPRLPSFGRLIELPDHSGATITVSEIETTELAGLRPFPVQPEGETHFVIDEAAYAPETGWIPGSGSAAAAVELGDPAVSRGVRVAPIRFQPVRYNTTRNVLEVAAKIRVKVQFAGVDLRNIPRRVHRTIPRSFDQLYRHLIVNYQEPRADQVISLGSYVIVCQDDPTILEKLEPLVEWRTRKGFDVTVVTTAETGPSAADIKVWIQTAYDTWENPPEYITLIGDATGAINIPCWFENYTSYHGETDHNYVQLDGDDILADAHIGRISVDNTSRLELYVNKIVGYESTPYMTETDWYARACVVGDPSTSGYTCVQIGQWLKERLLEWGYAEVDTVFNGPWVTNMTNALNRGDTIFSYRGFYGMSGFDVGDITSLQNGRKMPFTVNLTCDTGSFANGTSRNEAWIRAGVPPNIPTGGIASIATATIGTHTRYNNCVVYGVWRGIFWEDLFSFGAAHTRAKFELYINYWERDANNCRAFTCWNNLMGDPAGELWTGVPQAISVTHPATLAVGTNAVTVEVEQLGHPCEGAFVSLWMGSATQIGGVTDGNGVVEIPVNAPAVGEMLITVTKHDCHPYLGALTVEESDLSLGYSDHIITDDFLGNGDGLINPMEGIELPVEVQNFGTLTAMDVTGELSTNDPYVTIVDWQESFGEILGGETAWSAEAFEFQVSGGAPNGHRLRFGLDLYAGADSWRAIMEIPVVAGEFAYGAHRMYGFDGWIDPGETGEISVQLANIGGAAGTELTALLRSEDREVIVTDSLGTYGAIPAGGSAENTVDRFGLSVRPTCFEGRIIPMTLYLDYSGGALDTVALAIEVGAAQVTDPTGPDHYGYVAFDNGDTGYLDAPVYYWAEIDPAHGGLGASVGLGDFGEALDDSRTVALPFSFIYYGHLFHEATICSNGWLAMGQTYLTNYRNWNIPGAGAPAYMIAPMWDNLYQSGSGRVCHYYDESANRYIIQWSRVLNMSGSTQQNFQVILYDPSHYATETGDGIILFQYETFNNSDHLQHYSTVGIEDGDRSDGLLWTYFNVYNTGAATIRSGTAIKFMPIANMPRGVLTGTITNATNGGTPLSDAIVKLVESGETMISGPDGVFGAGVPTGTYTVAASHPSFAPDTLRTVEIREGETTVIAFSIEDIIAPIIHGTTRYESTIDTIGPYFIETNVTEYSDLNELDLFCNINGAGWVATPLAMLESGTYRGEIPGQPHATLIHYYIHARDVGGLEATDPGNAIADAYWFWVMAPNFHDDIEAGVGGWTHTPVTPDYIDQWHRSTQYNHTPGGSWAWKFGDTGSGNYASFSDGALITESIAVEGHSTLSFWHRMRAEESGMYPGYAYDGGIVEVSIDGGSWTQIFPEDGYTHLVRERWQGGGPFPEEMPFYSGYFDWCQARFALGTVAGEVQVRFRFGSDYAAEEEGWFIDDITIMGTHPGYAGIEEEPTPLPTVLHLYPSQPNPSRGTTRIAFDLPRDMRITLRIADANGRIVRTLADGSLPGGRHEVLWDGSDRAARRASSGVYYYVLEGAGLRHSRSMLLLR